ncbi:MAG: excinuclease ABC subunit UvrB [Thermoplasmata archaeon]|nr:excinuclease ABC subunit UvrB [Thermoplasmata archaeon]MCI4359261.1 excinuclease ABC subunit UvrB [Thermoplasmata archaeon]
MTGRFELDTELVPQGDQPAAIAEIVRRVRADERFVTLLGVTGSGKTFTMAHAIQALQRPTLVISPNKTLAAQLVSEFRALFPRSAVEYFVSYYDYYQPEAYVPQIDLFVEKDASINEEIDRLRHRATQALLTRRDTLIVASVSCIFGLGSPEDYRASVVELVRGESIGRQELLAKLVRMKYDRNDLELKRGRFRVRGGTIDVMGAGETVNRIVLDGSTLESISELDPVTGEEKRELDRLMLFPATHFLTVDERMQSILAQIQAEKEDRVQELLRKERVVEAQRLRSRTEYDVEMIRETGYCSGIENYARYFAGRKPGEAPYTLLDFFPKDFLVFIDESHVTVPQLGGMYLGDRSRKDTLVEFGWRLPSCRDNRPLKFTEFLAHVPNAVFVSATPGPFERKHSDGLVEQIIRPTGLVDPEIEIRPTKGQIVDLVGELKTVIARGDRALVTTLTKATSEDLARYLADLGLKVRYLHSEIETLKRIEILRDLRLGRFDVLVGINLLREGLDLPEVSLVAILDADKEGYLRSETSLIQTSGRASRNVLGKVLLYADRRTGSMDRAIAEMNRRRAAQVAYNAEHGIVPSTIRKEVRALLAAEESAPSGDLSVSGLGKKWKSRLPMLLANLEEEMRLAAERLDFEEAARIRDRIHALEESAGLTAHRKAARRGGTRPTA